MLVLTRENNEEIIITVPAGFSGDIKLAYLGLEKRYKGDRTISEARIGIKAPKDVVIIRSELRDKNENQ